VDVQLRKKIWDYAAVSSTGEPVNFSAAPVVAGNEVMIGCDNGTVHVVDLSRGTLLRTILAPTGPAPSLRHFLGRRRLNRDVAKQTRVTEPRRPRRLVGPRSGRRQTPMLFDGKFLVTTRATSSA
jgi:hypothetical protein